MSAQKVAILGAGVMGAQIAAQAANAGLEVMLLDIVPEGAADRNILAKGAIDRLLKMQPAPLMLPKFARRIRTGNLEDHLDWLKEADWVCEAVIEDLAIKQSLYHKIEPFLKSSAVLSSNTSTLPLAQLTSGLSENLVNRFCITHFFNPPRYMRLLEVVPGQCESSGLANLTTSLDHGLGKTVIQCKDTPGFIANRIGSYWLQWGLLSALELGLTVEEADAALRPLGIPKTGIFGLLDLVGLDLMPKILANLQQRLPADDPLQPIAQIPDFLEKMIASGFTGRKGKGGFYSLDTSEGKRVKLALDLASGEYRPARKPDLAGLSAARREGLQGYLTFPDKAGRYAWRVFSQTLLYAARVAPEIAHDIHSVDQAMKLGYNWKYGPFELLDKLGVNWFRQQLEAESQSLPEFLEKSRQFYQIQDGRKWQLGFDGQYHTIQRPAGVLLLEDVKIAGKPLARNGSASLWDIEDGVACLEFHSKMNTLDPLVMEMIEKAIAIVARDFKALVIYNEAQHFSAGANLGVLMFAINTALWDEIERLVAQGQSTFKALKYAPFPVVGAPSGMALGGGCEILLHCDARQSHAELYCGLVEVGVGLIPAWGGCKEMLRRHSEAADRPGGPIPPVSQSFEQIGLARVSGSAFEARNFRILDARDGITMNRDRVLYDAKQLALRLCENYAVTAPPAYHLPGPTGQAALDMGVHQLRLKGQASEYDTEIAKHLARVLSGGDTDLVDEIGENDILGLERQAFMHLIRQPKTLARLEHMLDTGKPLRN